MSSCKMELLIRLAQCRPGSALPDESRIGEHMKDEQLSQKKRFDDFYDEEGMSFGDEPPPELVSVVGTGRERQSALDLGCGDGRITLYLAKSGFRVTGVDLSTVGLDKLRGIVRKFKLENKVHLLQGDIRTVALAPAAYDLVVAVTVLDHLPAEDVGPVFDRIAGYVRPGGILFVKVHNVDDPGRTAGGGASELQEAIKYYFPRQKLRKMARGAFEILSYKEEAEKDYSHGAPHTHAFSRLLARKR